jgi:NitT/TauT family transport system substrate-binding protein
LAFSGEFVYSASAPPSIRVAYTSITGNRIPFWIAQETGLFEKHGLRVALIYMRNVPVGLPALMGGDVQILAGGVSLVLHAVAKGAKLTVFGTFGSTPYILFSRPEIKEVLQLKGEIIGVGRIGSPDYYSLRRLLQRLKFSPDKDVKIVATGPSLDRLIALGQGRIQATLGTETTLSSISLKVNRLVDVTKAGVEDHGSALITTQDFARTQTDVMDRFVRAFLEGISLARKNKELAKRVYAKNLRVSDDATLELNYQAYVLRQVPKEPIFPRFALEELMSDLAEENPSIKEINVGELLNNSFIQRQIDNGFVDQLYR